MSTCSTHVLDSALGRPASGVFVTLSDTGGTQIGAATTDVGGRARFDPNLEPGIYELTFATGPWFAEQDRETWYPVVTLAFTVAEGESHYHVALLLSPYAYTTYRGSLMGDHVLSDLAARQGRGAARARSTGRATRHVLHDLNVTSQLRGDFAAAYTEGDNSRVIATDTQKNTVYALAREDGVDSPETFLLRAGRALRRRSRG